MFRALYSGVSGLYANVINLDVIGNNIANSNTIGFKSGRTTFTEMLTQTLRGATAPTTGGLGGTNPMQVGLGTRVGGIDTFFHQGNLQSTGKKTDLALLGHGFFVLSDGTNRSYTRAGVFGLDSQSYLVSPSTGLHVQGVMAEPDGTIGSGPFEDIHIDPDLVMPAEASTILELMGNLAAGGDGQGTITRTQAFLAAASATDLLVDVSGEGGNAMGLQVGDQINLTGRLDGADLSAGTFIVTADSTVVNLARWLDNQVTWSGSDINFSVAQDGSIQVENGGPGALTDLAVFVNNNPGFNANMHFDPAIYAGGSSSTAGMRTVATAGDRLADLYDASGRSLGLDPSGDTLLIGGDVGGVSLPETSFQVGAGTTLGDLMSAMAGHYGVSSVQPEVNSAGQIVITGETGTDSALTNLSIRDSLDANGVLAAAFTFSQIQEAEDSSMSTLATTVTDALGNTHTVRLDFAKIPGRNEWTWTATMEGGETITSGGSGRVSFANDGTLAGLSYDDGSGGLTFQAAGTDDVTLAMDFGTPGGLNGLTQFASGAGLQALADGYGSGSLVDFEIGTDGVITGIYSNDTTRVIARIGVSQFTNPDGLYRHENNTYGVSGNSGAAQDTFAELDNGIAMQSGTLEASNVDLAKEFTNLVVAQRAFQANSRVISTADEIMQELVGLLG